MIYSKNTKAAQLRAARMHLVWIDWLVEFRARHIAATAGLRCGGNSCLARETHDDFLLWYLFEKLNALVGRDGYYPPHRWSRLQGFPHFRLGPRPKVSLRPELAPYPRFPSSRVWWATQGFPLITLIYIIPPKVGFWIQTFNYFSTAYTAVEFGGTCSGAREPRSSLLCGVHGLSSTHRPSVPEMCGEGKPPGQKSLSGAFLPSVPRRPTSQPSAEQADSCRAVLRSRTGNMPVVFMPNHRQNKKRDEQ